MNVPFDPFNSIMPLQRGTVVIEASSSSDTALGEIVARATENRRSRMSRGHLVSKSGCRHRGFPAAQLTVALEHSWRSLAGHFILLLAVASCLLHVTNVA